MRSLFSPTNPSKVGYVQTDFVKLRNKGRYDWYKLCNAEVVLVLYF